MCRIEEHQNRRQGRQERIVAELGVTETLRKTLRTNAEERPAAYEGLMHREKELIVLDPDGKMRLEPQFLGMRLMDDQVVQAAHCQRSQALIANHLVLWSSAEQWLFSKEAVL
jgi:hypothetical protein